MQLHKTAYTRARALSLSVFSYLSHICILLSPYYTYNRSYVGLSYILLHTYPQIFYHIRSGRGQIGVTQGAGGSGLSPDQMGVGAFTDTRQR